MSIWENYPSTYRCKEITFISEAVSAGNCVSIIGLSGSGKSNLVGYLTYRILTQNPAICFVLVDCNRLGEVSSQAIYQLIMNSIANAYSDGHDIDFSGDALHACEKMLSKILNGTDRVSLVFDRFDILVNSPEFAAISSNLRATRDAWKYQLTYVTATRKQIESTNELAELLYGSTIWLGPLEKGDAVWSARRDAARLNRSEHPWDEKVINKLVAISGGYPSLLRACCEAYAAGEILSVDAMRRNEIVRKRLNEFWHDEPTDLMLEKSEIIGLPLLMEKDPSLPANEALFDMSSFTAKEFELVTYLMDHADIVCEKDDLIRAVWPEDVIFQHGVRDDSLAQIIRRVRKKIEPNPSTPKYIHTIPGRGYLFKKP